MKAVKDKLTLTLVKDVKIVFQAERVSLIVWELAIFFRLKIPGAHQSVEVVWPREWTPGNDCCERLTFQPPAPLMYKDDLGPWQNFGHQQLCLLRTYSPGL